jgi:hypothetical protein
MTAKEAYEAGYPGTYMGVNEEGDGPSAFFPAPLCMACMGRERLSDHEGVCIWRYWEAVGLWSEIR